MTSEHVFDRVETAIEAIAAGELVIVADDEHRENEGDLVMAASRVTPETINMMIRHARGLICAPMTDYQMRRMGINPMVQENRESHKTAFSVSVDAAEGITTGISAFDRARTIEILARLDSTPEMLVQPGHVFPLRARPGGVLERAGHTEAAVDLASLAGLPPSGVICEILNEDGSCARLPELVAFKQQFGLKLISIADLIEYRLRRERLVEKVGMRPFDSEYGDYTLHVYRNKLNGQHHFALVMGELDESPTLVRVHSENILGDVFLARDHHSRRALERSLKAIAEAGRGVVLYMSQRDAGLNLAALGNGEGTSLSHGRMDDRARGIGAQILANLGLRQIRLLTSATKKLPALEGYDLDIVEQIELA